MNYTTRLRVAVQSHYYHTACKSETTAAVNQPIL